MLGGILGSIGGIAGALINRKNQKDQEKLQKQFAQSGIQWKVEDAKKAGIHPLYALGAQTHSYAPQSVGDVSSTMASVGQDLGRAIDATRTPEQKTEAYSKTVEALSLKRMELENNLLASQIAKINQAGQPPGLPSLEQFQNPQRTRHLMVDGRGIVSSPNSDQQAFEDRYGEVIGEIYGLRNFWKDNAAGIGQWMHDYSDRALRR